MSKLITPQRPFETAAGTANSIFFIISVLDAKAVD
jgi:hypothetical protein